MMCREKEEPVDAVSCFGSHMERRHQPWPEPPHAVTLSCQRQRRTTTQASVRRAQHGNKRSFVSSAAVGDRRLAVLHSASVALFFVRQRADNHWKMSRVAYILFLVMDLQISGGGAGTRWSCTVELTDKPPYWRECVDQHLIYVCFLVEANVCIVCSRYLMMSVTTSQPPLLFLSTRCAVFWKCVFCGFR